MATIAYRLDEREIRSRARWSALLQSASTFAPALLVVVLVTKLGMVADAVAWGFGALLALLAVARGYAAHAQIRRHLHAFAVVVDDGGLTVHTVRPEPVRVRAADVARVREIGTALGGLRVDARAAGEDTRVDIPRGGERFGELRTALEAWRPIERTTRRRRGARIALGAFVVMSIFFVPFMMDDLVGRSRAAAIGVVGVVWLAMLALRRR